MPAALATRIRAGLRAVAVPSRAAAQQAYMKSAMPYLGVSVPDARRVARREAASADLVDPLHARAVARELWNDAIHREERYAAMALLGLSGVADRLDLFDDVEHMVRTGRWWDYTDELAHRTGDLLDAHGDEAGVVLRRWARDDDLWIRRIAILSQLGFSDRLDRALLEDAVAANVRDDEFFIRKAIGWALRDAARRHPDWVRAVAARHPLSPLSRREALKHIGIG